jgi:hypothetical protein
MSIYDNNSGSFQLEVALKNKLAKLGGFADLLINLVLIS